jgi:uncharacterized membrane protein
VKSSSRISAFLAYLLPIVGWLFVLLFRKDDRFAVFHTKQSIMLVVAAIVVPLVWAVVAWILTWIPTFGAMTSVALFALVVAAFLVLLVDWILGMVNALRGKMKPLPMVGAWVDRIF